METADRYTPVHYRLAAPPPEALLPESAVSSNDASVVAILN